MKSIYKVLLSISVLLTVSSSCPYDGRCLTDLESAQRTCETETTALFDCLSDGQYSQLNETRKELLEKKVFLIEGKKSSDPLVAADATEQYDQDKQTLHRKEQPAAMSLYRLFWRTK